MYNKYINIRVKKLNKRNQVIQQYMYTYNTNNWNVCYRCTITNNKFYKLEIL